MAKQAKEKFLVLSVEEALDCSLNLRVGLSAGDRGRFMGTVSDGHELLGFVKGEGRYADRHRHPLPERLLLDWHLPRKDGLEVVEWLREQPFDDVVVVLSDALAIQEIRKNIYPVGSEEPASSDGSLSRQNLVKWLEENLGHK